MKTKQAEAWITCEMCSNQILADSGEAVLWTEYVVKQEEVVVSALYLCPDCGVNPDG